MSWSAQQQRGAGMNSLHIRLSMIAVLAMVAANASASEAPRFAPVGPTVRAPIGWVQFCSDNPSECATRASEPRDVVLSSDAFKQLRQVNDWVNRTVKPMTDMDHWGIIEKW